MASYLQTYDATPAAERWRLVRGWMHNEPWAFYAELRKDRPILVMPEVTLATRFDDCAEILRRHDVFSVALYKPKQGDYFMAQDDTAVHWREKSIMRAILDFEDIPAIRTFVASKAAELLASAGGSMEAVAGLTRAVPLALVQEWFGFEHVDPAKLCKWSYWSQIDTFWNQPFDAIAWSDPAKVIAEREAAGKEMVVYLIELVAIREGKLKLGLGGHDPVTRLLELSSSGAVKFDLRRVIENVAGLLIGAVETTSHAVVNALDFLISRPDDLAKARAAALGENTAAVDGYVFEAIRFRPAFPYFFRTCEEDAVLGRGEAYETAVPKGTTVLAVTQSGMFDPKAMSHPDEFDAGRGLGNQFHFGLGLHECLGRAIGRVMIPEIVAQSLRLSELTVGSVDRKGGPVPESWDWRWKN
ncbi:cytochrome P450 [Methylocapsa palsarum]|uniref:Cytochrome P450 n=1 Tax=Methylocapsa palsarum TaxID=1612308 RepID=A0A1I3YEF0_9HYPH|nr:cytochrome P450 [Methylocapsa palsarum]SFK30238.1 Cytochrome P450 [Methylocapsa palsarum]